MNACPRCADDQAFLRRTSAPTASKPIGHAAIADLFCGCGAMSIGLAAAAAELRLELRVSLAVDEVEAATDAFGLNFPACTRLETGSVEELFNGSLGARRTKRERELRSELGEIDVIVGGPPCQGHSTLNNRTRNDDPRNALYARMARAAEVLRPRAVIIENVIQVTNDRAEVLATTQAALQSAGYRVHLARLNLLGVGVPQRRRRHLLLATREPLRPPAALLAAALEQACGHERGVDWAIGDLNAGDGEYDRAGEPSRDNARRIASLFASGTYDLPDAERPPCHQHGNHTYRSMYGRLRPDEPAQTITTGFGSMGQGRYVHPHEQRTLTPHEAARLQTLPDYVQLGPDQRRSAWARMIGNAVPPLLTRALGRVLLAELRPRAEDDAAAGQRNTTSAAGR